MKDTPNKHTLNLITARLNKLEELGCCFKFYIVYNDHDTYLRVFNTAGEGVDLFEIKTNIDNIISHMNKFKNDHFIRSYFHSSTFNNIIKVISNQNEKTMIDDTLQNNTDNNFELEITEEQSYLMDSFAENYKDIIVKVKCSIPNNDKDSLSIEINRGINSLLNEYQLVFELNGITPQILTKYLLPKHGIFLNII